MRRTLLFFLFLFFLHSASSQNKTIGLVLKSNLAHLQLRETVVPLPGFEIGGSVKYPWKSKIDLVTGVSFRFFQYQVQFRPNDINRHRDYNEQLFHLNIPLEFSYKITPHRWRAKWGIWGSYLLAAKIGLANGLTYIENHRVLYSDLYFGTNVGFSHIFKSGIEATIDYSFAINNIYGGEGNKPFGSSRKGLDLVSFGIIVPIKL